MEIKFPDENGNKTLDSEITVIKLICDLSDSEYFVTTMAKRTEVEFENENYFVEIKVTKNEEGFD